ncbi:MAG: TonB family protein [bacterium]|nr:TonB family protein [bacterium]
MYISDKGIRRLSLVVTVLIHLLILLAAVPVPEIEVKVTPEQYRAPIQMTIKKTIPKKKIMGKEKRQAAPSKKKKKAVYNKKYSKKQVKGKVQKPSSLPGDRKKPLLVESIRPVYPKAALNNEWTGEITLELTIDKFGRPIKHKVVKSTGHDILDETFVRTVIAYYKFKPRRVMGKNVIGKIILSHKY